MITLLCRCLTTVCRQLGIGLAVITATFLISTHVAYTQGASCLPGWHSGSTVMMYGENCCSLQVEYCYRTHGEMFQVRIKKVTLVDPDCHGVVTDHPGLFSFLSKKVIASHQESGLQPCPTLTNVVETLFASCQTQTTQVINWYGREVVAVIYVGCSDSPECRRQCQACLSYVSDDCNSTPTVEYTNCQWVNSGNCPANFPGCINVCGS